MGGDVLCPARVAVAQKACTPRSSPNPVLGRHASIACEVQLSKVGLRKSIPSYRENRRALGLLGGETFRESADIFPIDAQGPSVSAWPCRALRPAVFPLPRASFVLWLCGRIPDDSLFPPSRPLHHQSCRCHLLCICRSPFAQPPDDFRGPCALPSSCFSCSS